MPRIELPFGGDLTIPVPPPQEEERAAADLQDTRDYYLADQEAHDLADKLIFSCFELVHLRNVPIRILMRRPERSSKGRLTMGSAHKASPRDQALHGCTFVIVLWEKFWKGEPRKHEALLFHELCHCWVDEEGKAKLVGHDIEEHYAVIRRYGDWQGEVEDVARQLSLFGKGGSDE
ncbi:putative metallopeptidase [Gloeobacter kilaueensis]|uniref:Putative phage metallopeptidase domain-containing protein n=1 Tax=Gloeobacter kilaueensis (strain ATCC BAA-2537 / CCAP 1431/1 / ULC 316 / JS1) TaxID=1183438 RepID=U5QHK5_GLOK1|nr:putative metallopeptidase [Gloeobacter kilaueensis]AGY57119.1 hypothetical protein GKIL_0873 [Gloeobacter kilaueensis JS1]